MRTFLQLGLLFLFGYGALLAYVYFFQSRLVYFPNIVGTFEDTPADIGLAYEEIRFTAADGVQLHGWYVPVASERAVVLFLHGNAGNITHRLDSIALFHRLGLSVFIFDYRGYGQSEGSTTEQGTYVDAEAAWSYLIDERKIAPQRIVLFGRSLGASIATWLASRKTAAALITESAFTSAPDLAAKYYWFLPVRALSRFSYDTKSYIEQVTCPVLVIHSAEDEIIPFEHGKRLFASAAEPKRFLELHGGHNDAFFISQAVYTEAIDAFLAEFGPALDSPQ